MDNWNESLEGYKMNATTTEYIASLLAQELDQETRERLLPCLFLTGEYEMEFIYSFAVHMVDMLAEVDKNSSDDDPQEFDLEDLVKYSLQHMGIDGHIK